MGHNLPLFFCDFFVMRNNEVLVFIVDILLTFMVRGEKRAFFEKCLKIWKKNKKYKKKLHFKKKV